MSLFASKKEKGLAKTTFSNITKSGYLIKHAKSGYNWKKRYFMLNGNTLTYCSDHRHTETAKGDVLLTEDATVEDFSDESYPFGFTVSTQFVKMKMAAKDAADRADWTTKIRLAISDLVNGMRGYLYKSGRFLEAKQVRKFFMLHNDCITYHQDLHRTATIQGMRKFSGRTTVEKEGDCVLIIRTNLLDGKYWKLRADSEEERDNWAKAVEAAVKKLGYLEVDFQNTAVEDLTKTCLRSGFLNTRPKNGGQDWEDKFFVLMESQLYQFDSQDAVNPSQVLVLSPNCSVFETKLQEFSFELVTNSRVLHVQGENPDVTASWIKILRHAIANSKQLEDPLLLAAKKQKAIFYDVVFETKKPLGLVLERSGDWALVKLANQDTTHVSIGSALTSVNGSDVILSPYQDTIRRLTAWQPPLRLGFRLAPEKRGWLTKQGRGRKSKRKNWKPRYFVLAEGRLSYFSDDGPDAVLKGVIHLMGSAVSLVPRSETGQYFCLRVVSGITGIIMQGLTVDDMMEWAAAIYHAISVANGGGFLLDVEREMQRERDEEKARKDEAERAEKELRESKKREEELAEEARKAKEEAEEAKREAEEAERAGKEAEAAEARRVEEEARKKEEEATVEVEEAKKVVQEGEYEVEALRTEIASIELEKEEKEKEEKEKEEMKAAIEKEKEKAKEEGKDEIELPEGTEEPTVWQAYWNSEYRVWYYFNLETQQTSWERPDGVEITVNQPDNWVEEVEAGEGGGEREEEEVEEVEEVKEEEEKEEEVKEEEEVEVKEEVKEEVEQDVEQDEKEKETGDNVKEDGGNAESPPPVPKAARRRSTVPVVPPMIDSPPPPKPEKEEEEEDEDEDEDEAGEVEEKNAEDIIEEGEVVELNDKELTDIFSTIDRGVEKGQLNPMLFGTLIRTVTGNKNLYEEMKYFQTFNTSGDGVIDLDEWLEGVKKIKEKQGGMKTVFYRGLVKYHLSNSCIL